MLVRIVKMSFEKTMIDTFKSIFNTHKASIRNFPGCRLLKLYQDKNHSNIFFTYSYWNDEADLENYRTSELFKKVWSKTKIMFNDKPQAWSVDKVVCLP